MVSRERSVPSEDRSLSETQLGLNDTQLALLPPDRVPPEEMAFLSQVALSAITDLPAPADAETEEMEAASAGPCVRPRQGFL